MVDLCHRHFDFSLEQQPKKNTQRSKTSFVSCVGSRGHQAAEFAARGGGILPPRLQAIPDSKPGRLLRMLRYVTIWLFNIAMEIPL